MYLARDSTGEPRDSNVRCKQDSTGEPRDLELECKHDISPHSMDQELWCGLTSDLIDVFNYYDWIGYLILRDTPAIDQEVARQKFGPWIINYYQICEYELKEVWRKYPDVWRYLRPLYDNLIEQEKAWYKETKKVYPYQRDGKRTDEHLNNFLRREHVRSHRGAAGGDK